VEVDVPEVRVGVEGYGVDAAVVGDGALAGLGPVGAVDPGRRQVVGQVGERAEAGQFWQGVLVQDVHVGRVARRVHRLDLVVVVAPVGRQGRHGDGVVLGVVGVDYRLDDARLAD